MKVFWAIARAFLIAVVVLVTLDLLLGLVSAPDMNLVYDADPHLFWRMRPNIHNFAQPSFERTGERTETHISTNSIGIRDDEVGPKATDEFRVLCMGDSSIFGHGVELPQTFERQLQDRLQKLYPGRKIRVINGGVSGYSSFQGRQFFHELAPKIQPDVVVLGYYFSDFIPDIMEDRLRVPPGTATSTLSRALARSNLYQFIRDEMEKHARQEARSTEGRSLVARVTVDDYRDNMSAMIDEAGQTKAKVVLLLLDPRATPVPAGQKAYREAMASLATRFKVPLVDMEGPFGKVRDRASLFVDEVHPSPAGDAIIADELLAAMKAAGFLPPPAPGGGPPPP
jgi:lysophospholipase L1-like esterase